VRKKKGKKESDDDKIVVPQDYVRVELPKVGLRAVVSDLEWREEL